MLFPYGIIWQLFLHIVFIDNMCIQLLGDRRLVFTSVKPATLVLFQSYRKKNNIVYLIEKVKFHAIYEHHAASLTEIRYWFAISQIDPYFYDELQRM